MKALTTRVRRGTLRALFAAVVLAGVFAMHGLTGDHNVAMALGHESHQAAHATAGQSTEPGHAMTAAGSTTDQLQVPTAASSQVKIAASGHDHSMGEACLGMLTVLGLALLIALALRCLKVTTPAAPLLTLARLSAPGPSPPPRPPSLSKLCVLRI